MRTLGPAAAELSKKNKMKMNEKVEESSHREKGLLTILSRPWVYNLFTKLVQPECARIRLVQQYIRPFPGCRILEIGCGTAPIVSHLPRSIAEYDGFDMNPLYIESARKRWNNRPNYKFICQKIEDTTLLKKECYDIVLAFGIIHHLGDNEARHLFSLAHHALKSNGTLVTYDNVFIENQHWFAKWLISKDRGRAVRTVDAYTELADQCFDNIECTIQHDALRIPYTVFIMRCIK